jgi:hypothetical protein
MAAGRRMPSEGVVRDHRPAPVDPPISIVGAARAASLEPLVGAFSFAPIQ